MGNPVYQSGKFDELRRQAKELLQYGQRDSTEYPDNIMDLIEELKIYQIELEIQNEELKESQQELSELHQKYVELYEFAPCGYVTLDSKGIISEINLSGVRLLGAERSRLYYYGLGSFIATEHQGAYFTALKQTGQSGEQQVLEFRLKRDSLPALWIRADIIADLRDSGEVQQWRLTLTDITERKQAEELLNYMSFHDALTGLYNRNFFEMEMKRYQDSRHVPMGIIVCDVDSLKFINDHFGHKKGDELLINTAAILKKSFRSGDIVARIGGDEFAALLPQTEEKDVAKLVERLENHMREHNSRSNDLHISFTNGYAVSYQENPDMVHLLKEADDTMYQKKVHKEKCLQNNILHDILNADESRDIIHKGYSDRLPQMVLPLAKDLKMPSKAINDLFLFAKFHDVGKLGISDNIMCKQDALNEHEHQIIRKHSEIGYRIAHHIPELTHIADWILKHHERWDGQGHPLGLQGEDIPLECRIVAIADAYDAMTSDRPYRKAMSPDEAVEELRRGAGTQFDPDLVEQFIQTLDRIESA